MNTPLIDFLADRIRHQGPLPFDLFMEQALYHPGHGYYASGDPRTGREGDFLTPVSPGPVLGELLARQADELYQAMGRPKKFRLVEQGPDTGNLARDLLVAIHQHHPDLAKATQLHLLEPHPRWAEKQKQTLKAWEPNTRWHHSWESFSGDGIPCFFYSCELVDSFPIRIFRHRSGTWREQRVGLASSGFRWQETDVSPDCLRAIRRGNPPEMEGFTVELRPSASTWVESWAGKIESGLVVTLDYGFSSEEMRVPSRAGGSLAALRGHQRSDNPLAHPGRQDLTAHVNFSELEELGTARGFKNYGLTDFARGLTALAASLFQPDTAKPDPWIRNFRHLTHPAFFGHSHRILIQGKSLPASFTPSILMKV